LWVPKGVGERRRSKETQFATDRSATATLRHFPTAHARALIIVKLSGFGRDHALGGMPRCSHFAPRAGGAIELAFWESVRDTDDPRLLAAYREKYPEGEFAAIALVRLEALREAEGKRS
jgi:hypothetical protein